MPNSPSPTSLSITHIGVLAPSRSTPKMTFTSLPIRVIAPCLATLPTIYLAVQVYARLAATPASHVTTHPDAPESLRESATVRSLVNPQSRTITGDSRTIDIDVSGRASQTKDEVLLSAFARGFFGGSVFGLERLALKIARPGLLNFPGSSNRTTTHALAAVNRWWASSLFT